MSDSPALEFHRKHIVPILEGEKTVTVRYAVDRDTPHFAPYEEVSLVTPDGKEFATARIITCYDTRVDWFAMGQHAGHRTYYTTQDLMDELQSYYPNENIEPGHLCTVYVFAVPEGLRFSGGDETMTVKDAMDRLTHESP